MSNKLSLILIIFYLCPAVLFSQNLIAEFEKGKLEEFGGIPILTVKGNPYQAGFQYGKLMNEHLVQMDQMVDSLLVEFIGKNPVKRLLSNFVLKRKIKKWEKRMPQDYLDEIDGMIAGSTLKSKDIKLIAYFPQLFFNISCTSFVVKDNDELVHGRNLDWPGMESISDFPLLVNYHIEGKHPFTNLTYVGYPGVYTGMNREGVSASINMNSVPPENGKESDDYNTSYPLAYKLRDVLENAVNLSEADQLLEGYESHSWFVTIGSKQDNSGAVYELTRGEVIANKMIEDIIFVENLSLSQKGRYMYSPVYLHSSGNIARENKFKELAQSVSDDLVLSSYNILKNYGYYDYKQNPFFGSSINNSITVIGSIMDNRKLNIYFSYNNGMAALGKFIQYNLKTGKAKYYQHSQNASYPELFVNYQQYNKWKNNFIKEKKNKLDNSHYESVIHELEKLDLDRGYKSYELSRIYKEMDNLPKSLEHADSFIELYPEYYYSHYNKYLILKKMKDWRGALSTIQNMLETESMNPYYNYVALRELIYMTDKTDDIKFQEKKDQVLKYRREIKSLLMPFYKDERTLDELDKLDLVVEKYK